MAAHRLDPFEQRFKRGADVGIEQSPFLGRHDMAPVLRKQLHAERVFDQLNLVIDRGRRQAQFARRLADRLMPRRRFKATQRLERRQIAQIEP